MRITTNHELDVIRRPTTLDCFVFQVDALNPAIVVTKVDNRPAEPHTSNGDRANAIGLRVDYIAQVAEASVTSLRW
jgi:hypothetical protein